MTDVIVIAGCTHRAGLLDVYEGQLRNAGIEFQLETGPTATSSFTMRLRIAYWRELALRYIGYKTIVVTDGWDVLFFGTKQDLLDKSHDVLISAERNYFPGVEYGEEDLTGLIKGDTLWKYANPGMIIANPIRLLDWLDRVEESNTMLDISDQAWCNRRLADGSGLVLLDTVTRLFYVISYSDGRLEDGALKIKDGRLWNSQWGTYPNFFHFAGHGPNEARRVLPGPIPPRYEAMRLIREFMQ